MSKPSTLKRLTKTVLPYRYMGLFGLIATALYSGLDAGFVYLTKYLIDDGFIARDAFFVAWAPVVTVLAFTLRGATSFVSSYAMTYVARSVVVDFRKQIFRHFMKLPSKFYDNATSGQLLSKLLYDAEQVAQVSMDALTIFVQSLCIVVGLFIVMLLNSVALTAIYLLIVPVIAVIVKITNKRIRRVSAEVQDTMGDVTSVAEEVIEGYQVVRLYGGQVYETEKFDRFAEISRVKELKVTVTKGINVSGVQLVASFGIALIIFFAISPDKATALTAGSFSSLLAAMLAMLKPLKNLSTVNSTMQRGLAGAESIFELLDAPTETDLGRQVIHHSKGHIAYHDVSFAYQDKNVLKHINLEIQPGETVAFVGRSGGGKSTLVHLLPRFYDVQSGCITLDGQDIQTLTLKSLRQQMAIVSQHVTLFNDTVAKNIAYGGELDMARVKDASVRAHAMEFIDDLPQGLETLVGENGVLLSGGQRQRLAIARAIYKNAPILILDEATSALDSESERHIQLALASVMAQKTTLVIAHRLSTIENADKIVVIDKGEIQEVGTHQQLMDQSGFYTHLQSMQSGEKEQAWLSE